MLIFFVALLVLKTPLMNVKAGILAFLLLAGCTEPTINYVLKVKLQALSPETIYDAPLVYDVIFDAEELDIDSLRTVSRQLFLQGVDQLKNHNKPDRAVKLFKNSILTLPDAKTYYELGNAILKAHLHPEEAIKAYEVAEYLQFQPLASIYYAKACAYNALNKKSPASEYQEMALHSLEYALVNGFEDTLSLKKDPRLKEIVRLPAYRNMLTNTYARALSNKPEGLFALFTRSFPLVAQPFEIRLDKVDMKQYGLSVSYEFAKYIPEMQNSSFGRDVSHDFFYVARVAETKDYVAVLYASVSFYEEDMQPVLTKLATYDTNGNLISTLPFSCQCSAEKVKKGKVENNIITIEDYRRVWEHPIDKVGFEKNTILSYELLSTATFRIETNGKITTQSAPDQYTDTVILASGK